MRRTLNLLIVLTVGHVLLISAQVQAKSGLPLLEAAAFGAFASVQRGTASVADAGRSFWSHYLGLRGVAKENEGLRTRVLVLEGQVQEQEALLAQTHALQEALAFQRSVPLPTLAARVIAGDPQPGAMFVTIDRGSDDGVKADMAVLGAAGLIGRVVNRPAPHASQVQLIVGRSAHVGVTIERGGTGAVASGGVGDPPLHLDYVPNSADVKKGDRVISSGQDRIYPAGFLVGTVEHVARGSETYQNVSVRPSVDFSHIDLVLVVLALPAGSIDDMPAAPPLPKKGSGK